MDKRHAKWLAEYLENCSQVNRSPHTIKNYEADLKKFLKWFEANHNYPINKATGETITEYKEFLAKGGPLVPKKPLISKWFKFFKKKEPVIPDSFFDALSISSRKRHLSSISNFFEYLKQTHEDKSRLFDKNPVKPKIHSIKLKDVDTIPTLNLRRADWDKIHKSVYRTKERLIIYLLYWGGLRLSELSHLRISDFDPKDQSLRFVRKGGYVHHLKPQKAELIFEQLEFYLNHRKVQSEFLFANKSGKRIGTKAMYNLIMKIFLKAGCSEGLTPHSFRKACATNLYIKTKDLLLVRDYLNHKDAKVTQTYIDRITLEGINHELKLI